MAAYDTGKGLPEQITGKVTWFYAEKMILIRVQLTGNNSLRKLIPGITA